MDDLLKDAVVECFAGRNHEDGKGAMCHYIKDGKVHICSAYTKVVGKDPQSEKEIDEWRCAISWMPIIGIENSQTNRGQTQAIELWREEVARQNKAMLAGSNIFDLRLMEDGKDA